MKFAELNVGTEYAVIPAWDYSSKEKKDASIVRRNQISKAKLVSFDKYEYVVYRSSTPDATEFKPAPQGSRSVGYLVESYDWSNSVPVTPVYWLARPQDIVAEYSTLEVRWAEQERIEAEQRKAEMERRAEQERLDKQMRDYADRIILSCTESLKDILGANASKIESGVNNRRDNNGHYVPVPYFQMDGRTMQILIEKVLEARDMVA